MSLELESIAITHLSNNNFEVLLNGIGEGGGYDFLAKKENIEIELECKNFTTDLGNPVHQKEMGEFVGLFRNKLSIWSDKGIGGWFVHITLKNRLDKSIEAQKRLADKVINLVENWKEGTSSTEDADLMVKRFDLRNTPLNNRPNSSRQDLASTINNFVSQEFQVSNEEIFTYCKPKSFALILVVKSSKGRNILDAAYSSIKKGCEQFSGTRPAILIARFSGLNSMQLEDIAGKDKGDERPSAFKLIANRLFEDKGSKRAHMHSIVFMPLSNLVETKLMTSPSNLQTIWGSETSVYFFENHKHPKYCDKRYSIFSK